MCEKQTLLTEPSQVRAANRVGGNGRFRRLVVRCGVALLVLQLIRIAHFSDWDVINRPSKHPRKSWRSGKPIYRTKNSTIGWHVCPDNPPATKFLCSTHKVPLNWLDPVKGENVEIFLRMLPADDDKRQGSLVGLCQCFWWPRSLTFPNILLAIHSARKPWRYDTKMGGRFINNG